MGGFFSTFSLTKPAFSPDVGRTATVCYCRKQANLFTWKNHLSAASQPSGNSVLLDMLAVLVILPFQLFSQSNLYGRIMNCSQAQSQALAFSPYYYFSPDQY